MKAVDLILVLIIVLAVTLAIRAMLRSHKNGGNFEFSRKAGVFCILSSAAKPEF